MELFRCLIGSQNYGLDDETSDKDYYVYHVPNFEDLYHNKSLVREEKTEEGILFHKDIRSLPNMIIKASFNQLEVLFSDLHVNNMTPVSVHAVKLGFDRYMFYKFLMANREQIARANMNRLFKSTCGEVKRRVNDLQKGKYTAGTEHLFEKYGYDTKNAMHTVRLINLWDMIYHKKPLEKSFKINLGYLAIKQGDLDLNAILDMITILEQKYLIPFLDEDLTDHSIDTDKLLNEMNDYIFNIVKANCK